MAPITEEMIILVDDNNRHPQKIARSKVIAERLPHRSAIIMVFNSQGELFLQQRVASKQAYPNHWDCSCAGAVSWGESYRVCAARELTEELGIKVKPSLLKKIGQPFRVITAQTDEFDQLFCCRSDGPMILQESEVADGKWIKPNAIDHFLACEQVTPWFVKSWEVWKLFNNSAYHASTTAT
jgi:isopentenyldiphosphate isomerase